MPASLIACRRLEALLADQNLTHEVTRILLNDRLGTSYTRKRINEWTSGVRPIPAWVFCALEVQPMTELKERWFQNRMAPNGRPALVASGVKRRALFRDFLRSQGVDVTRPVG